MSTTTKGTTSSRYAEVAAFATGAEAHLTGELAVCAGVAGRAIYTSSMVYLTAIVRGSHCCEFVSAAKQMPRILEVAIREAVATRSAIRTAYLPKVEANRCERSIR